MRQLLRSKFAHSLVCAGIFATLLMFAGRATAQTTDLWTNTAPSTWNTAGNWGGGIPTGTVVATFSVNPTSAGAVTISSVNATAAALSVAAARTGTVNVLVQNVAAQAATLTLTGTTVNAIPNTIISTAQPYLAASHVFSVSSATTGSLGLVVNTTGGAVIQVLGAGATASTGDHVYIGANISGSQPITILGGGTNDLTNNTSGFSGGMVELAGTNTFSGGLTLGDSNFNGVPDWGKSCELQIDNSNALPSTGTYTVTVNNNSVLYLLGNSLNFSNPNATMHHRF